MITSMRSTRSATLGVMLLAAAHAWAEEPPPSSPPHHTHHSHHRDKDKDKEKHGDKDKHGHRHKQAPVAADAEAAAPAPAAADPAATATDSVAAEPPAAAAEPHVVAPSGGVSKQVQSNLHESQTTDRPWVKGVSAADQSAAIELFHEGNGLLKESLFVQAAAKYREALHHWDHPGIHYNLALALLNLD
jgi:hypothetical protein